jgi:glycosyltransferase involved in cell wall biosynthesis
LKRLLFVVNHAGFFLSHRLPIALAAQRDGYEVHVATPNSKHVPLLLSRGLTWHPIRLSRSSRNPLRELLTLVDLYRLYRDVRPDIVHHVTPKPVLYGSIVARLTRVPAVVNAISGMGHIFVNEGVATKLTRGVVSLVYRLALRHRRMRIIFQNREDRAALPWLAESDCVQIPGSGVDTEVFRPGANESRTPAVLFAARMLYTKGVGEFVSAARLIREKGTRARFLLAGEPDPDNPASVPLEQLQAWHSAGIVEYLGRREDMPAVFAEADVFCMPSYYGEGLPKVLVEASAAGIPSVTTDWPGCRDVVEDGVTGFLVPVRDVERLATAIEKLIVDPALREQMGARARARAEADFSLDRVVAKTLAIYRELGA